MPAVSKRQANFMKLVYAYKKGALSGKKVGSKVKAAASSMSAQDARDFTKTGSETEKILRILHILFPLK